MSDTSSSQSSRRFLIGLVGLLALGLLVAVVIKGAATTGGPAREGATSTGNAAPSGSDPGASATLPGAPSKEEQLIYDEVSARLGSGENPANQPIPKEFQGEIGNEAAFEAWTLKTMQAGIKYQEKVFAEVAKAHGRSPKSVAEIHAKVYDWRLRNNLPLR